VLVGDRRPHGVDAAPRVAATAAAADHCPDAVAVPTSSGSAAALDRAGAARQER